jgi:hypothetical protein
MLALWQSDVARLVNPADQSGPRYTLPDLIFSRINQPILLDYSILTILKQCLVHVKSI